MNQKYTNFTILNNDQGRRLDSIVRKFLPNLSLSIIFKQIRSGDIRVNGNKVKPDHRLEVNDILSIYTKILGNKSHENENIKIGKANSIDTKRIIYENEHILIYNKDIGELVHGDSSSLEVKVKNYLIHKVEKSLSFSPGPLHRLDRNTQGLITFSVSLHGAREFSKFLKNGKIKKIYITIVSGEHKKKEVWIDNLQRDTRNNKTVEGNLGKTAETHFIPLVYKNGVTLALMDIKSGRTHQIRAQSAIHGKPLVADNKYNYNKKSDSFFLAAIYLSIKENNDIMSKNHCYIDINDYYENFLKDYFSLKEIEQAKQLIKGELNL